MSQIQRVEDRIGPLVIQFMRERLATHPVFLIQELLDYVARSIVVAPASPQRILQLLRREGHYNYEVVSRSESKYRVLAVYDSPRPDLTQSRPDASNRPPSPEAIDAAIAEFASMANIAGHQGSDEGPFWAAVACIEWALGRPSTVDYVPCYVSCTLKDAEGKD